MSQHSGSISPLSEHPASPALLTNDGPHRHLCSQLHGPTAVLRSQRRGGAAWFTLPLACMAVTRTQHPRRCPPAVGPTEGHGPDPRAAACGGVVVRVLEGGDGGLPTETCSEAGENRPGRAGRTQASVKEHAFRWSSMPIHSSRIGPGGRPPGVCLSCVALPDITTLWLDPSVCVRACCSVEPSYPEGNFRGNQLLGGSIGLSPLCRTQATQFARQNSDRPPPQFPMASSWNGIVHHLSGPMDLASTQNPVRWTAGLVAPAASSSRILLRWRSVALSGYARSLPVGVSCTIRAGLVAFTTPCGFVDRTRQPAGSIDSLIRVSRRAEGGPGQPKPFCVAHSHPATSGRQAGRAGATIGTGAATHDGHPGLEAMGHGVTGPPGGTPGPGWFRAESTSPSQSRHRAGTGAALSVPGRWTGKVSGRIFRNRQGHPSRGSTRRRSLALAGWLDGSPQSVSLRTRDVPHHRGRTHGGGPRSATFEPRDDR
jgi:hypothetical protein